MITPILILNIVHIATCSILQDRALPAKVEQSGLLSRTEDQNRLLLQV